LGIAKAAIATIKPSIKYLTIRLISSVTSNMAISVYINKKEKKYIYFCVTVIYYLKQNKQNKQNKYNILSN
jgi:hypothetical protein